MNPPIATRLILLPRAPGRPVSCLHLDSQGRIVARQPLDPSRPPAAPTDAIPTLVAVPGEDVRVLWLDLPAHTAAQALAAARILLDDHIAGRQADLHVAIGEAVAGAPRPVAVVAEARMGEWLERCRSLGVAADAMVPDHLLVTATDEETLQVAVHDGAWLVRGPQLALAAEPDLALQIIGPRRYDRIDDPAEVEAALARSAVNPQTGQLDLLQHAHARRRHARTASRARRIALLATLCLLSPLLLLGAQTLRHALGARWLEQRADALAAARLPQAADASAALHALHRERAAPGILAVQAAALSDAVARIPGAGLDSLEYAPESGLRAGLLHAGEADLEILRGHLAANGIDLLPLESEAVDGGRRTRFLLEQTR